MKNPIKYLVNGISNLGTKSGMPKYTAFLGLLQGGILFIPESILAKLGVDALQIQGWCPEFVQYYIINSSFKNAMSVFWLLSPFTLTICTALFVLHANGDGYPAYLCRRSIRLKNAGKTIDFSLIFGVLVALALYVWSTAIYLAEPTFLGAFVPAKNRLAMLIIHAGAVGVFFPGAFAVLVTEIRANLSATKNF